MLTRLEKRSARLTSTVKEFEVQFKWLLTWLIFFFLRRGWPRHGERIDPARINSILFLRYDRIGDMVVSLPTFHVLKALYPHIQIDVLASPGNRTIISQDDTIRNVLVYDKGSFGKTWKTIQHFRRSSYDVTVDLVANVSATSLIILLLAGRSSFKIGVRKNNSVNLYDFIIPEQNMRTTPAIRLHFASLQPLGIAPEMSTRDTGIRLSEEQWRRGADLIAALRRDDATGLVGINISAGKPNREWGVEKYIPFVREISAHYPRQQFLVFAGPTDYELAEAIANASGENVAVVPRGLSLLDIAAMMKHLNLMMTPDTSICHIASSLGIPLLGLYTAAEENFLRWQPYNTRSWVLRPSSGDTLEGISVEDYIKKADEVLAEVFSQVATR
jgi:heptosyltransferase-3